MIQNEAQMGLVHRVVKWLFKWPRLWLGLATVPEICEASKGSLDFHDYPISKGGDDCPWHMSAYTCWNCGKKFYI